MTSDAREEPVRLHIEDSGGNGRPVVLIHGWPLSAQAWEPQVSALSADGFRVVAYDRRGFGRSDKPASGYGYDVLVDDLQRVMDEHALVDVTLVGFSMGGGEVARYVARHGASQLRSVVFAAAVPPYLMKTADNADGPLTAEKVQAMRQALVEHRHDFFEHFTDDFYSANGDADAIVPIEGSGLRTHDAVPHSQLIRISGAPHGLNVSRAPVFNDALLQFLRD